MTLPTNIILPIHTGRIESGKPEDLSDYFRDLIFELQSMYEDIANAVNGNIKADYNVTQGSWIPKVKGSTTPGSFTYTNQVGYSLRRGIVTDVWFDVSWTAAGTAAGNLIVELPYKVAKVSTAGTKPFVGVVQPSSVTYTAGTDLVVNATPDTFDGEIWTIGDGVPTANQAVVGSGQLIGHVRYIGQQNEN